MVYNMTYLQGTGQQGTVGIRSVQELQNLTGQSNETITNNTDIASPSQEWAFGDKSAYDTQQGQGVQQQK